ncbi:unnamed protein product [Bemisia tabaci]|uniref:Uncharacterized protein n=1 Tax=Bemisia tabaci TaxID=7038 RepID=A0A9P0A1M5_BEMTA|nr:unnamed protein product [Bemisia tabaci]
MHSLLQGGILHFDVVNKKMTDYLTPLLRKNECIQSSWMTGSFYLGGVMRPMARIVQHIPFDSRKNWGRYFGVTQDEARSKLRKFHLTQKEKSIEERYLGYRIENSNSRVYDMVSITRFLVSREPDFYWNDVVNPFLKSFADFFSEQRIGTQIKKIITGDSINTLDCKCYSNFSYTADELQILKKKVAYNAVKDLDVTAFIVFLREAGYLSTSGTKNALVAVSEQTKYALRKMLAYNSE